MPRLFLALRPPPAIRRILLETMHGISGAHWQDDEHLHLTLRFLGEVDVHAAEDLALALESFAAAAPALVIAGIGTFGKQGRANSVWASVPSTSALQDIHRRAGTLIRRLGIPTEARAFTPHVTLARLNRSCGPIDAWSARNAGLRSDTFVCDHLYLYESELGHAGSTYTAVTRVRLS